MLYKYKMVEVPRDMATGWGKVSGAAAGAIGKIVEQGTKEGYEFYRIDTLSVTENPGCLGLLFFWRQSTTYEISIVTLRKPIDE